MDQKKSDNSQSSSKISKRSRNEAGAWLEGMSSGEHPCQMRHRLHRRDASTILDGIGEFLTKLAIQSQNKALIIPSMKRRIQEAANQIKNHRLMYTTKNNLINQNYINMIKGNKTK